MRGEALGDAISAVYTNSPIHGTAISSNKTVSHGSESSTNGFSISSYVQPKVSFLSHEPPILTAHSPQLVAAVAHVDGKSVTPDDSVSQKGEV